MPIGHWVIGEACRQAAAWAFERDQSHQDRERLNIAVNISVQQLADPMFQPMLCQALEASGFAADQLWLEITEGIILHDPDTAAATLHDLRRLGVHIAIDDFGTGYSSLSYLKRLPVEILKIDQSFIDQLDNDSDDRAIVRAVIALGDSLGMAVIGEGVERSSQAAQLSSLGCDVAQGFLYGRPLPASEIGACPTDDLSGWLARRPPDPGVVRRRPARQGRRPFGMRSPVPHWPSELSCTWSPVASTIRFPPMYMAVW